MPLERRDLFARHARVDEPCLDLLRLLQVGNQYGIKFPVWQGLDRPQRVGEKRPLVPIHESDQGQVHLAKADVRQLGQFPRPANGDPLSSGSRQSRQHDFQASPHVPVIRQGILQVEIRETGFLGHPPWGEEVFDAVPWNRCDLDIAFAGQALEIEVGQAKRDAEFFSKRALCDSSVLLNLIEELQIALVLNIHKKPRSRKSVQDLNILSSLSQGKKLEPAMSDSYRPDGPRGFERGNTARPTSTQN